MRGKPKAGESGGGRSVWQVIGGPRPLLNMRGDFSRVCNAATAVIDPTPVNRCYR
jgi:hypothetical protein